MSVIATDEQESLLMRLSYLVVRTYQSRARHYSAAANFKRWDFILNLILIICSSITTAGIFSILSGETIKSLLKNDALYLQISLSTQIVSALFAAITAALSVSLTVLSLQEKGIMHEQSGHDYTQLRDDVIDLAHKIRFCYSPDLESEVHLVEQKCNSLGYSAPVIPPSIHKHHGNLEANRRITEARYWLKRFLDPGGFTRDFLAELEK